MRFLVSVILLTVSQSIMGNGARNLQAKSVSPTVNYWHEKLPTTAIPNAILKLVSPVSSSPTVNTFINRTDLAAHRHISAVIYRLQSSDEQILASPSVMSIILLEKDFRIGRKVTLDLDSKNSPDAYFIPRTQTHKIPFSSNKLSLALKDLNIPQGSEMAVAMKQTLKECERPGCMNGESKFCADSLESMIDHTTSILGTNHVNALALDVPQSSKSVKQQQYSVVAFPFQTQYASKTVVCHRETYAYAVYYCHEVGATRATQVSLKGEDGSTLQGVRVCHANTSIWNPEHAFLKVLNVKPGPAVCHFIMQDGIVWVPSH